MAAPEPTKQAGVMIQPPVSTAFNKTSSLGENGLAEIAKFASYNEPTTLASERIIAACQP